MARSAIQVDGLREFRRDLRGMGGDWIKELPKVNKQVAEVAAEYARGGASSVGGVTAKAAYSIVPAATRTSAKIRWGGRGFEFADGAFFGSKQYRRFAPWIGNSWEIGVAGEGPYGINPALAARTDELGELYLNALANLLRRIEALAGERSDRFTGGTHGASQSFSIT